jgi:HSP20 family protein
MSVLSHRDYVPDIYAWFAGPVALPQPAVAQSMRMEEQLANGRYLIRAELPGVDPAKDIEVSVSKGVLTVHAERHEEMAGQHRSEFRYGTFTRHVALPVTAVLSDVQATYDRGILEISVGLKAAADDDHDRQRIPVQVAGQGK